MMELKKIKMILGTGLSSSKEYKEFRTIVQSCLRSGISAFDTAPSYGTERLLGTVLTDLETEKILNRSECWIQTKIDAWQMQESDGDIRRHLEHSLKSINTSYFDSVLIHWPVPEYLENTLKSLEQAKAKGLVRYIGVCNVRKRHIEEMFSNGHKIDIVQIERHPLRTYEEGVLFLQSKGVIVQAYSPLCKMNTKIRNNETLMELSKKYKCTVGQLIMRWHIDTGVIPVFTSKKPSRILEYADIFKFYLDEKDIAAINRINENYKMYLESWLCPGF